jgi:hypothetical protein
VKIKVLIENQKKKKNRNISESMGLGERENNLLSRNQKIRSKSAKEKKNLYKKEG